MNNQTYSSTELTHFVGGLATNDTSDQERFVVLTDKILVGGKLLGDKNNPQTVLSISLYEDGAETLGERAKTTRVCFCDITVENLPIHRKKYGNFGLAFAKDFLVGKGASPVFYVEQSSFSHASPETTRAKAFSESRDLFTKVFQPLNDIIADSSLLSDALPQPLPTDTPEQRDEKKRAIASIDEFRERLDNLYEPLHTQRRFLLEDVYPFVKLFDSTKDDDDPDNYYMEREWRVVGSVEFAIDDVQNIILPPEFEASFRAKFPEYRGLVTPVT